MLPDETRATPGSTPAAAIVAFRRRFGLSQDRLAEILALDVETLRGYEQARWAPSWVAYALLGVEYQESGVVTGLVDKEQVGNGPIAAADARPVVRSRDEVCAMELPPIGEPGLARDVGPSPADSQPAAA